MTKYMISWTNENWYRMDVEAESKEDALDKFWRGKYNWDNAFLFGEEVQDSIDIWELDNG